MKQVCKSFYLSMLGLTSDKMVTTSLSKSGRLDGRGRQVPVNKTSDSELNDIKNHIFLYNPCISHYRCTHAPLRLYLPP